MSKKFDRSAVTVPAIKHLHEKDENISVKTWTSLRSVIVMTPDEPNLSQTIRGQSLSHCCGISRWCWLSSSDMTQRLSLI